MAEFLIQAKNKKKIKKAKKYGDGSSHHDRKK